MQKWKLVKKAATACGIAEMSVHNWIHELGFEHLKGRLMVNQKFLLCFGLCCALMFSRADVLSFDVKMDHADCLYKCGETASFTVTAKDASGNYATSGVVSAIVDNFGAKYQGRPEFNLAAGNPFKITGKLDEPGFLRIRLSQKDGKVKGNGGGPADFYTWGWGTSRRRS